ncbi:hypothetical protein CR513_40693, partial [Mucuna pruriens]
MLLLPLTTTVLTTSPFTFDDGDGGENDESQGSNNWLNYMSNMPLGTPLDLEVNVMDPYVYPATYRTGWAKMWPAHANEVESCRDVLGRVDHKGGNTWRGAYNPIGAQNWLQEIEMIIRAMVCVHRWSEVLLEDIRNYKGMEFLHLKHGNRIMTDYVAKLKNHWDTFFVIGIRLESTSIILQAIIYQEIHQCPSLMNRCMILDKDNGVRVMHFKSVDLIKERKFSY